MSGFALSQITRQTASTIRMYPSDMFCFEDNHQSQLDYAASANAAGAALRALVTLNALFLRVAFSFFLRVNGA